MSLPYLPSEEMRFDVARVERVAELWSDAKIAAFYGRPKDLGSLTRCADLQELRLPGVDAKSAEVIAQLKMLKRLVVFKYGLADLMPLGGLSNLECLVILGSPKLKSLAGIERLQKLKTAVLFANCNYTSVAPLGELTGLEALGIEGGFSKNVRIDSLNPLANLSGLEILRLASIRVADKSLRPLHALTKLREVFITKHFPASELKAMADALPQARGEFLDSSRQQAR